MRSFGQDETRWNWSPILGVFNRREEDCSKTKNPSFVVYLISVRGLDEVWGELQGNAEAFGIGCFQEFHWLTWATGSGLAIISLSRPPVFLWGPAVSLPRRLVRRGKSDRIGENDFLEQLAENPVC